MIDKKEIAARVLAFSIVEGLAVVVATILFDLEWLSIPLLVLISAWGIYYYRMNVRVLGMPVTSMDLEGSEGKALTAVGETGKVKVRGEIWNAISSQKIEKGKKVKVLTREGIVLEVELVED